MSDTKLSFGDRVRHPSRPEWGIGTIVKVEPLPVNGHTTQRLSIRFPNAGMKTLIEEQANLQRMSDVHDPLFGDDTEPSARAWDRYTEDDWISPIARKKVFEALIALPQDVRDPFFSLQKRLQLTLHLYRFDKSGKGLIDWAVAQTGIDDPLTRFSRQELEQYFARFAGERESHLTRLLQETRGDMSIVHAALENAPASAREAVRKVTSPR